MYRNRAAHPARFPDSQDMLEIALDLAGHRHAVAAARLAGGARRHPAAQARARRRAQLRQDRALQPAHRQPPEGG